MITQKIVRELLTYREDGVLIWKENVGKRGTKGNVAGSKDNKGYWSVKINSKRYLRHRLIWLWWNGFLPENSIDHINQNKGDDRIENLREISQVCNSRNMKQQKNSSGVKGVSWHKKDRVWVAAVGFKGKTIRVGHSRDLLEAVCYRLAAEQCLGWEGCEGTSPAYVFVKTAGLK